MSRPRLIPCLLLKNGSIVRSQGFKIHQVIGNPMSTVERFSHWNVDELIILDISDTEDHGISRDDVYQKYAGSMAIDILKQISKVCFIPLAFGGRIRNLEDIQLRLAAGADKVVINTKAYNDPDFISQAAKRFGTQCIVVSIDVFRHIDDSYEVYIENGKQPTGLNPVEWAREVESLNAGEIFLNSINRDGSALGYDLDLIRRVTEHTTIPIIACGGVGKYADFPQGILEGNASALSAANIFHFFELSYPFGKKACVDAGIPMRKVRLGSTWFKRTPKYDNLKRDEMIAKRLEESKTGFRDSDKNQNSNHKIRWCTRCVYPSISAALMEFDEDGICMGCRTSDQKNQMSPAEWKRRKELLRDILEQYRSKDRDSYDCVIPVSGGKDSYFQTHVIKKEFGLNPLLITYNGNNYTSAGWHNVHRMKEVFGVDHLFFSPSVELLKKLNRLAFITMGDMNWHGHLGLTTLPVRMQAQLNIPLIIWGEHGYLDASGQFSMNDFPEMSYRDRLEHFGRGYEWNYFIGCEGITEQDMSPYRYPEDQDLYDQDIRGIYMGNFVYWEANDHGKMVVEKYGFQLNEQPFDRTYRRMSNLDDMHENGVHDYLKYIKFGYGRCTDHACKDIRAGLISRDRGIELVKRYDSVRPRDLERWTKYVGISDAEFDAIADTFRDQRVWRHENGQWVKDNIWD